MEVSETNALARNMLVGESRVSRGGDLFSVLENKIIKGKGMVSQQARGAALYGSNVPTFLTI